MTTKLEKDLKREILIDNEPYTVTISPMGLKLVPKGKRKGQELTWKGLVSGQTLSNEVNASTEQTPE